ncbi:MAG: tetratricopeptide repeat protein, partial [Methanosarcinales archaeon]
NKILVSFDYVKFGDLYNSKGKSKEAIECYDKALELNPEYAKAYNNRGNAYYYKGELDLAIEDYNKAIKLNPDLAEAYNNRGNAYYNISDVFNCANDIGKSAFLFFLQNSFDKAINAFKETYNLRNKTNNPICYECGLAYAIVKNDKEIIKEVRKHKDKLSESASLVLDYLITGKTEKEIEVKDERDEVFKRLLEGLKKSLQ